MLLSTPEGENRAWRLYRRLGFTDVLRNYRFTGDPRPFGVLGRDLPLGPPSAPEHSPALPSRHRSDRAQSIARRLASGSRPIPPMFSAAVWKALRSNASPCRCRAASRPAIQIRSPTLYDGA